MIAPIHKWVVWTAVAVVFFASETGAQNSNKPDKITIDLKIECKNDEHHTLVFALTNLGPAFEGFDANLPWCQWDSINVFLYTYETKERIKERFWSQSTRNFFEIKHNETLKGEVRLVNHFPELSKVLTKSDVDLFWSYQMRARGGVKSNRIGGWLKLETKAK